MRTALIGYTGFVGGNLLRQRSFDFLYNSGNFRDMSRQSYDEVVCAGVSAAKWKANKEPERDRARIRELEDVLTTVQTRRFILISTIDVYPVLQGEDESFDCHSMPNHPYGTNRLAFEDFCVAHFDECHVVRLPGLFGPGLKKNVIFDLLNDNCLESINPDSSFQFYHLARLWTDILKVVKANVRLLNLFTEPVPTRMILDRFFPEKRCGQEPAPETHYDLHTCRADLWGRTGRYVTSRTEVLKQMQEFLTHDREER